MMASLSAYYYTTTSKNTDISFYRTILDVEVEINNPFVEPMTCSILFQMIRVSPR